MCARVFYRNAVSRIHVGVLLLLKVLIFLFRACFKVAVEKKKKKDLWSLSQSSAGGNCKGRPGPCQRACVRLEQPVPQLQGTARRQVLGSPAQGRGGGEGGNRSFSFLSPFLFKGKCSMRNHFTVGLGLFVQSCQFPYLNVGWGFFPSYSSLNEGDSCCFYVSLA